MSAEGGSRVVIGRMFINWGGVGFIPVRGVRRLRGWPLQGCSGFTWGKSERRNAARSLLVPQVGSAPMAAISISAPIVAKAPVAVRRTRVTARAAVAPAASGSAVSFGARKMMTGASVQASRVVQTAAGRKSLVWCVSTRATPRTSRRNRTSFVLSLRARRGESRGPRRAAIAEAAGGFRFARSAFSRAKTSAPMATKRRLLCFFSTSD
jgi:hypothetical protein